ncbi:Dabb family protein [Marivivens marinus]|uniref:Dabb family protein n=1 Tax=Marivivens marinus TaxID=3110173 RepID=UPI003B847A89
MIRHLVHLRFRADVSQAEKQQLFDRLAGLADRIDGVLDFQHRANVSVETPLVRGFLDMFWFDFRDVSVRDAYLVDEVHQVIGADIVAALEGGAEGVFVCDVEI